MTKDTLQAIVDEVGGPEKVVGFRMANGTKFYFSKYALNMDDVVTMGDEVVIKLYHTDTMGRKAVSFMLLDELVWVYTIDNVEAGIILRDILD